MLQKILKAFGVEDAEAMPFGSGLINRTWKVCTPGGNFILQKINDQVFRQPEDIAHNIRLIADYLKKNHPDYFFISPVASNSGEDLVFFEGEGWFRCLPFVENSVTIEVVSSPRQAYEAARQFGKFTRVLSGFDVNRLKITIPQFHDLDWRYRQFLYAISNGNRQRKEEAQKLIDKILGYKSLVEEYRDMIARGQFKLRVTHHDTKISNVLFDRNYKGICVIDLDTVMPGFFISDLGDMVRTYVSPVNEEETDLAKIYFRKEYYDAIVQGYLSEMDSELTSEEKKYFFFSGKFIVYMQALRFLTDYLNNDQYYGSKYQGHNLNRAGNQAVLLQALMKNEQQHSY